MPVLRQNTGAGRRVLEALAFEESARSGKEQSAPNAGAPAPDAPKSADTHNESMRKRKGLEGVIGK